MIDYNTIPDGASDEIVAHYLKHFLKEKDDLVKERGIIFAFEQLEAIAENDMICEYESEDIEAISSFIRSHLDFDDLNLMDLILTIVIQMHLASIWQQITQQGNINNQKVKALIDDAIGENEKFSYFKSGE